MKETRIGLYRILRTLGLGRHEINHRAVNNIKLNLDKLDREFLLYYLESKYDINIPDVDFIRLNKIEDAVTYIEKRMQVTAIPSFAS